MKRYLILFLTLIVVYSSCVKKNEGVKRPKLVVGMVIDQMRWDYLYRYSARYGNNGFKRLMREGYNCQNTMINYLPSFTGPGHTCIYTGSVPSMHGIAANDWIDNTSGLHAYCVDDSTVHLVGAGDNISASMSPRSLLVTTITDELRLSTNLGSRVYGIALKDRGSILPAGHLANAAYWLDDSTGNFCSSNYYPNPSPQWLQNFNKRHLADSFLKQNWTLLYPANTYTLSLTDANQYEKGYKGEKAPVFPHTFDSLITSKDKYNGIKAIPAGNTMTLDMARECVNGEKLGRGDATDFLCVSLSSTDYVGHQFAPNSMEVEDTYLRLDKDIADFLDYLDATIGRGNYLFFLTADHGAAHNPQYLIDEDVPAGFMYKDARIELNTYLKTQYGQDSLVSHFVNYQVYLDDKQINDGKLDKDKVKQTISDWFYKQPGTQYVADLEHMDKVSLPEPLHSMLVNGYNHQRSGCMQVILAPGWFDGYGKTTGTTHGTWNPYDTHIPLLWYGWHVPKGETHEVVNMTDIAPTVAALLNIQMPNGCIGKPIKEVVDYVHVRE